MSNRVLSVLLFLAFAVASGRAAPEDEVRAAVVALEQALQAPDPTAWVYHYTEDAGFAAPGMAPVQGRAALLLMAQSMSPLRQVKIEIQRLEVRDGLGFTLVHGSWVEGDPAAPATTPTRVRSLIVWRREADGQWRVAQELMHEDSTDK